MASRKRIGTQLTEVTSGGTTPTNGANIADAQAIAAAAAVPATAGAVPTAGHAASSLIGNPTGATGSAVDVSVGGGIEFSGAAVRRSALTGDVTAPAGSGTTTIANGAVTNVKRANMAASTLSGNATASPAAPTDLTVAAVKTLLAISFADVTGTLPASAFPALTGDVTTTAGSLATTLANLPQSVLLARLALLTADLAVNARKITNLANPTAGQDAATKAYVDSATGASGTITALTGDVVASGSGSVTATIQPNVVSFAKMQDIPTLTLVGRQTAATGDPQSIGVTGGVEFDGAGNIRVGAFTGDVVKSAGSAGTAIVANAVTNAQLADVPTGTLKGRTAAGTGDPSDLTFAAVKTALAISFLDITGTLQAAQFPALTGDVTTTAGSFVTTLAATGVTAGTFGDGSHSLTLQVDAKGRVLAISAPSISISAGAVSGLSTVQTGALIGDVTKPAGSGTTTLANIPNDTPMAGDLLATQIADPAAPAAGKTRIYASSADPVLKAIAAGGVVTHTVRSHTAVAHQFLIEVTDDGNMAGAQPAVGDLQAVAALTTLANPSGSVAAPIAATVAQMRAMLGINDTFDLVLSFGTNGGTAPDSNLPNGTFFTSPFWLMPTTRNSDVSPVFPYAGNPTYIDANISRPEAINEFPVNGTFTRGTLELYCTVFNITPPSGSPFFTLTMSKNGACDSSPISLSKSSVGPNTMGSIISLGSFSVVSGDRVGLRFTSNSVNNNDTVKFTATLRLFN